MPIKTVQLQLNPKTLSMSEKCVPQERVMTPSTDQQSGLAGKWDIYFEDCQLFRGPFLFPPKTAAIPNRQEQEQERLVTVDAASQALVPKIGAAPLHHVNPIGTFQSLHLDNATLTLRPQ
ncbi:hypothetical protein A6R68_17726, partial [Neotoma lepida]